MTKFQDPTGPSRVAIFLLCLYMLFKGLAAITRFYILPGLPPNAGIAFAHIAALYVSYIAIACWIYRTNANAHLFDDKMTISAGWSVGWFLIPIANLVMPYRALNETWQASHKAAGRDPRSTLVGWWWALFLGDNIVSTIGVLMTRAPTSAKNGSYQVNLLAWVISVAASLVLIQLMRRLNKVQLAASRGVVGAA